MIEKNRVSLTTMTKNLDVQLCSVRLLTTFYAFSLKFAWIQYRDTGASIAGTLFRDVSSNALFVILLSICRQFSYNI